jgi:hypothetical protein
MRIALIGSAKFERFFVTANVAMTLSGHTVYGLSAYPSQMQEMGGKDWYTEQQKTVLDLVHLSKIEESEFVVMVNNGGYVGESTRREMLWCVVRDRPILGISPFLGTRSMGQEMPDSASDFGMPLFGFNLNEIREWVLNWKPSAFN